MHLNNIKQDLTLKYPTPHTSTVHTKSNPSCSCYERPQYMVYLFTLSVRQFHMTGPEIKATLYSVHVHYLCFEDFLNIHSENQAWAVGPTSIWRRNHVSPLHSSNLARNVGALYHFLLALFCARSKVSCGHNMIVIENILKRLVPVPLLQPSKEQQANFRPTF